MARTKGTKQLGVEVSDSVVDEFRAFCEALTKLGVPTGRGRFGASMEVELTNRGPATFLLES